MDFTLSFIWYLVIGIAIIFYVALDGFDLGTGMLHLFTKTDRDRRIFLNAIGPVWDGNEVWLVIVAGGLLAGFPPVYATLLSGFYNLIMIFLCGLIFRAVAIEFRSKQTSLLWRKVWDITFSVASFMIGFILGLELGNLIQGVPLDQEGNFIGSFGLFFRPYPILIGLFTTTLFIMHGSIYLTMKTEGVLHEKLRIWVKRCILLFVITYFITTLSTWMFMPHMVERIKEYRWLSLVPVAALLAILNVPRLFSLKKDFQAFLFSCLGIILMLVVFGIGTFPNLVRSLREPDFLSLNFLNSSGSELNLTVLLIIVAIGLPFVFCYSAMIYRVFRGKVKIESSSY